MGTADRGQTHPDQEASLLRKGLADVETTELQVKLKQFVLTPSMSKRLIDKGHGQVIKSWPIPHGKICVYEINAPELSKPS